MLSDLSKQRQVQLLVPYVAWEEWFSQIEARYTEEIENAVRSLKSVSRKPWLVESPYSSGVVGSCDSLTEALTGFQKVCLGDTMGIAKELGFRRVELDDQNVGDILTDYFSGNPPFKNAKSSSDFPDAFILKQIRELCGSNGGSIVAVEDKLLKKSIDHLGHCTVNSLKELLSHPRISSLHVDKKYALWWVQNFPGIVRWLGKHEEELSALVEDVGFDSVLNSFVSHHSFPNSVLSAEILEIDRIRNVEYLWIQAESVGEGIVSVPVAFDVDCVLHMWIHAQDFGNAPKWFDIDDSVIEANGFCSATGECTLAYGARLVVKYGKRLSMDSNFENPDTLGLEEIEMQDLYV